MKSNQPGLKIGLVGPCAAGKTTLAQGLIQLGYIVRQIAQEHSYVPTMWQIIAKPDILIFLDVSYEVSQTRKKINMTAEEFQEQLRRLRHARQNAHLVIHTNNLTPAQVFKRTKDFLYAV